MLDYQAMRERDLANRAKKNAHKVHSVPKTMKLEEVLRSKRMQEREQVVANLVALKDQLQYAKELLDLYRPHLKMWEFEVGQGGDNYTLMVVEGQVTTAAYAVKSVSGTRPDYWQYRPWARAQAERHRDRVASLERSLRTLTNEIRGKEAHLAWLDRRVQVTKLHTK